jgi:glycosyltransferase involved in cell wall biosynthesis
MATSGPLPPLRVGVLAYGLDRPLTGIGRYAVELVRALRVHRPDVEVILLKPFAGPIPDLDERATAMLPGARLLPAMMALGPVEIAVAARRHRLDVIHDPAGISPFLVPRRLGPFARVVTVHDMVPFIYPETHTRLTNFLYRRYIPRTLRFVDRIVTVSESSRRDILTHYRVAPDRVARIYFGATPLFGRRSDVVVERVLARLGVQPPYFLSVGSLQPRKNLETVFEALALVRRDGAPHRLVVVGERAWRTSGIFQRLEALGLGDAVVLTGRVDDESLAALYSGTDCFVFPSLYEGFGSPPLEAMACGAPVVASNVSSLPEVVGDAGVLVRPRDVAAIAAAMATVATDAALRGELRVRGLERARRFTMTRVADEHAKLYRLLVEEQGLRSS